MTNRKSLLPLALAALALAPATALAQVALAEDHADLGIGFEEGALELHWHLEDEGIEYAPGEAYAFAPLSSNITRPAGAQWDFTGAGAGSTIYIFPEVEEPGVLFLGLGSEEIADGTFINNTVTLALTGISGPGEFSLWRSGTFPDFTPAVFLSSADDIVSFDVITGGHEHFVWGFTQPGVYDLNFTVSGLLDDGISTPVSDVGTFTFSVGTVIPEPSSYAAFAGLGMLGFAVLRRRRN